MAEKPTRPEQTEVVGPPRLLAGKYRIGKLIGEGGMGTVYLAEHTGLDAQVAVKLLNETCVADPDSLARFRREAKAMGAVRHDNVVAVMDTGTDEDGIPFIVMEYLEGETLSSVLRRNRTMAPASATRIASQILAGLAAAHQKGIIHRDLKPGNVFMARQPDGTVRAKILDFGVSKLIDAAALSVTADGVAVGTPTYMAPEQIRGLLDLDSRVDIYAVGVILYRMLTGKLPYVAGSSEELGAKILEGKPKPPSEIRPEVPPPLEKTVLKAMSPKPDDRFADSETFRAALASALSAQLGAGSVNIATFLANQPGPDEITGEAPTVAASPQAKRLTEPPPTLTSKRPTALIAIAAVVIAVAVFGFIAYRSMTANDAKRPALRFGIKAFIPEPKLKSNFEEFVDHISDALGRDLELRITADTDELIAWIKSGEVDMAALSPLTYVRVREKVEGLHLLASPVTKGGRRDYRGAILVRTDSKIRALTDVAGRPFCFVDQSSTSGWLLPRRELRAAGIDPETAFPTIHWGRNHLGSLKLLDKGACDAAAVYSKLWHDADDHQLDPAAFRSIASYQMPHDVYIGAPGISDQDAADIRRVLLALEPDSATARKVLKKPDLGGFVTVKDAAYAAIREAEAAEKDVSRREKPATP